MILVSRGYKQGMIKLYAVLLLLGFLCFLVSSFWSWAPAGDPAQGHRPWRVNLVSLGLMFWILVPLIQTWRRV